MEIAREISVLFDSESFEQIAQIIQDNETLTSQEKKYLKDTFIKGRNVYGRKANMLNALCIRCQSELSAEFSCLECIRLHIKNNFSKWTSGDKLFDFWIQKFQLKFYARSNKVIEWVPFDRFQNIKIKASGGFANVYIAKWIDGSIISWDAYKQKFLRGMPGPVILKSMKNPENQSENFYQEILVHITVSLECPYIVSCYGLTKEPESGNYMMILEYLFDGDLKDFLKNEDITLSWRTRYSILHNIASALSKMHLYNILHGDIHPGNIISSRNMWCVEMMKRCWNTDSLSRPNASELLKFFTTNLQKIYKNELIIPELDNNLTSSLFTSDNDLAPKIINTELHEIVTYKNAVRKIYHYSKLGLLSGPTQTDGPPDETCDRDSYIVDADLLSYSDRLVR
ncbi:12989_t:CDS:2, partial [Dentiscutata heterogama]